jgi:hypothetical protein
MMNDQQYLAQDFVLSSLKMYWLFHLILDFIHMFVT